MQKLGNEYEFTPKPSKLMQKQFAQTNSQQNFVLLNCLFAPSDLLDCTCSCCKQSTRPRAPADELSLLQDFSWQWWGQAESRSRTETATDWFVPAQHRLVKQPQLEPADLTCTFPYAVCTFPSTQQPLCGQDVLLWQELQMRSLVDHDLELVTAIREPRLDTP
jgi:hypothetical protein